MHPFYEVTGVMGLGELTTKELSPFIVVNMFIILCHELHDMVHETAAPEEFMHLSLEEKDLSRCQDLVASSVVIVKFPVQNFSLDCVRNCG